MTSNINKRLVVLIAVSVLIIVAMPVFLLASPSSRNEFVLNDGMAFWSFDSEPDGYDIGIAWGARNMLFMPDVTPGLNLADILGRQAILDEGSFMLQISAWEEKSHSERSVVAGDWFFFRFNEEGIAVLADMRRMPIAVRFPGRYMSGDNTIDWWVPVILENGRAFTNQQGIDWLFNTDYVFSTSDESSDINMPVRYMFGDKWYSIRFVAETLGYSVNWIESELVIELSK